MREDIVFPPRFMKLIRTTAAKEDWLLPSIAKQIWLADWRGETTLAFPFDGQPFTCILWNNRPGYVSEALLQQLLRADCKYFVFGGHDCEQWHNMTDHLHLELYARLSRAG